MYLALKRTADQIEADPTVQRTDEEDDPVDQIKVISSLLPELKRLCEHGNHRRLARH
jgi:hypothetical protein